MICHYLHTYLQWEKKYNVINVVIPGNIQERKLEPGIMGHLALNAGPSLTSILNFLNQTRKKLLVLLSSVNDVSTSGGIEVKRLKVLKSDWLNMSFVRSVGQRLNFLFKKIFILLIVRYVGMYVVNYLQPYYNVLHTSFYTGYKLLLLLLLLRNDFFVLYYIVLQTIFSRCNFFFSNLKFGGVIFNEI